ncbi:MAG: DUF6356 family protein [Woeseiaceae bacterium]
MSSNNIFTAHPKSVGETYGQHFVVAMSVGGRLLQAAFYCAVHAIFPFVFEKSGSAAIEKLHHQVCLHREDMS